MEKIHLATFDTYIFNKEGILLSTSRYEDKLHTIGLLEQSQTSAMNIVIRDPGLNMLEKGRPSDEISTKGILKYTNSRLRDLAGVETGDEPEKVFAYLEQRPPVIEIFQQDGLVVDYEIQTHCGGGENSLLMTFMKTEYNGEDSILAWAVDITERKKDSQKMRGILHWNPSSVSLSKALQGNWWASWEPQIGQEDMMMNLSPSLILSCRLMEC